MCNDLVNQSERSSMDIYKCIEVARSQNASDLHLAAGSLPLIRVDGMLTGIDYFNPLTEEEITEAFVQIATFEEFTKFKCEHELDFKCTLPDGTNLRCNAAQARGQMSLSIRFLSAKVPTIDELQLPDICKILARLERGLVIISGPTGSGKTTTQAAMIEYINTTQTRHILSFEDPIEYIHRNVKSKITQRELGGDTFSFARALKHALRHDPDVIVVGEMRDSETAAAVISLAETGHLVISTGHGPYAAQAVERIIDLFPHNERFVAQLRLASLLTAVLCQTLVPRANRSGRIAAVEIMVVNAAIRNLIREGKLTLLANAIHDYGTDNVTLDEALFKLYWFNIINMDTVVKFCHDPEEISRLNNNMLTRKAVLVH
jgi:twitching motility protein PilT